MDLAGATAWLDSLVLHGVKAGLEHTRALAHRLGDPQRAFPAVLVAGTNGKGSTCAFLEASLRAAGLRTGFYSSPHLVDVRERVRLSGEPVEAAQFADDLRAVRRAAEEAEVAGEADGPPTFFEALTLAAFRAFARRGVDLAVVEVGLGGRLDCTNILDPILSVVTSIGLDHQEYLGDRLEAIAREKAGIFRRGAPALLGPVVPSVRATLAEEAGRSGARLLAAEQGSVKPGADGRWTLETPEGRIELPPPGLLGRHQVDNAALAARAAMVLRSLGWDIPDGAVETGVAQARWPGRLHRVPGLPETWLDGAHNPDGCLSLAAFAADLPRPRALVFTCMRDKDPLPMAEALFGAFDSVWMTELPMARCAPAAELAERCGVSEDRVVTDAVAALEAARTSVGPGGCVVAAGSLYLVGHLLARLGGESPTLYGTGL